jgi:hypothetical protein
MHVDPIRKFGRYPHRNACLGRESSAEEKYWLSKGETFGVSQGKDELRRRGLCTCSRCVQHMSVYSMLYVKPVEG